MDCWGAPRRGGGSIGFIGIETECSEFIETIRQEITHHIDMLTEVPIITSVLIRKKKIEKMHKRKKKNLTDSLCAIHWLQFEVNRYFEAH